MAQSPIQNRNTITLTRGNIGQLASFIGATALLVGLLGWLWQGELTTFSIALLAVGAVGMILWAVLAPSEFIGFITGRQARQGTIAVFSTLLIIGIVTLMYIITDRAVITLDMTDRGGFSLSQETLDLLDQVNREIRITAFFSPQLVAVQEVNDQFFRLYTTASDGMVSREYIDPIRNPALATSFQARDGDIFISYVNPDGTLDRSTTSVVPQTTSQERDMTQAIARLLASGNFTVYFATGHGEISIEDTSGIGISNVNRLLQENGFATLTVDLNVLAETGGQIPQNATAIIIARPREQYSQQVVDILDAYLGRGGALFIMADANFGEAPFLAYDSLFNGYLWENWGIRMLDAVVIDEGVNGGTPLDVISYAIFDSPITANINPDQDIDTSTEFRVARAIEVNMNPPVNNGVVIQSSELSYGETNFADLAADNQFGYDDGADILGPMTTVAQAFDAENDGQILLVGDSDFATNGNLGSPRGNAFLLTDGIGWMTGFTEEVQFSPQAVAVAQPLLFVAPATLDRIAFVTLLLLPGLTLISGLGIWYWRSRR